MSAILINMQTVAGTLEAGLSLMGFVMFYVCLLSAQGIQNVVCPGD